MESVRKVFCPECGEVFEVLVPVGEKESGVVCTCGYSFTVRWPSPNLRRKSRG